MQGASDAELLAKVRAGDAAALEALLTRYQPTVYRFGLRMCRNVEDAKDVVQETLLAVARTVRGFRGDASLSTWLYAIARSHCIKKRRRSKFAPASEGSLEDELSLEAQRVPDGAPRPDETMASRELREAIEKAIAVLDPKYREVLLLRDVEGLSTPEVSAALGLRIEAVKSRLHRARLQVRARLAPLLGATPETAPAAGCPDVLGVLSRHLEGDIAPEQCAAMERHLASCQRCRMACDSLRTTLRLCRDVRSPAVPEALRDSVRDAIRAFLAARA